MVIGLQLEAFLRSPSLGTSVVLSWLHEVGWVLVPKIMFKSIARCDGSNPLTVATVMPSDPGAAFFQDFVASVTSSEIG